jgi:nucleotide-binding universal stress UspA family protein
VVSFAEEPARVLSSVDRYLNAQGVVPKLHRGAARAGKVGDDLLSVAADVDADLLVMGCYGHSRVREWAVGGASRTILQSMTLPVLMVH